MRHKLLSNPHQRVGPGPQPTSTKEHFDERRWIRGCFKEQNCDIKNTQPHRTASRCIETDIKIQFTSIYNILTCTFLAHADLLGCPQHFVVVFVRDLRVMSLQCPVVPMDRPPTDMGRVFKLSQVINILLFLDFLCWTITLHPNTFRYIHNHQ